MTKVAKWLDKRVFNKLGPSRRIYWYLRLAYPHKRHTSVIAKVCGLRKGTVTANMTCLMRDGLIKRVGYGEYIAVRQQHLKYPVEMEQVLYVRRVNSE